MPSDDQTDCPQCSQRGSAVDTVTVKALLKRSLIDITAPAYRFCPTTACPVVYFAVATPQVFIVEDLREVVYQKAPTDPSTLVCYCFRHTVDAIDDAVQQQQGQQVIAAITTGIKAGACACDLRNPQGRCCLGNVRARVQGSRGSEPDAPQCCG